MLVEAECFPLLLPINLLVNPEKKEEYSINRTSNQDWKNCKYLGSLLGDDEDIKRRKLLACEAFRKKN